MQHSKFNLSSDFEQTKVDRKKGNTFEAHFRFIFAQKFLGVGKNILAQATRNIVMRKMHFSWYYCIGTSWIPIRPCGLARLRNPYAWFLMRITFCCIDIGRYQPTLGHVLEALPWPIGFPFCAGIIGITREGKKGTTGWCYRALSRCGHPRSDNMFRRFFLLSSPNEPCRWPAKSIIVFTLDTQSRKKQISPVLRALC